jgi:hypothetical protein
LRTPVKTEIKAVTDHEFMSSVTVFSDIRSCKIICLTNTDSTEQFNPDHTGNRVAGSV